LDVAQYIPLYADASDEHLRALSRNLLTLESDPANQATIGEVFRSAHTLKGMSATMGFDPITDLTHQMEGVLDLVRSGKLRAGRPLVGLLLSCVDSLQEMVQQAVSGQRITTDTAHLRPERQRLPVPHGRRRNLCPPRPHTHCEWTPPSSTTSWT